MQRFIAALLCSLPAAALAFGIGETPVAGGLRYLIRAMTGATGAAIATLAIIAVGLLCLGHYLEWRRLLQTVAGVAILFGAEAIVSGIRNLAT